MNNLLDGFATSLILDFLKGFLALVCFILMLYWLGDMILETESPVIGKAYPSDYEYNKKRMKYHGILFCYKEKGTWYFDRKGEKCKL